jgi:hypothetical protein
MSNEASENVNLNFKNAVKYILPSGLDCEKSMHSRARANKSMPICNASKSFTCYNAVLKKYKFAVPFKLLCSKQSIFHMASSNFNHHLKIIYLALLIV